MTNASDTREALIRFRNRRRGAWMWPAAVVAIIADAVIGSRLPPTGDRQSWLSAALVGGFFSLLAIVVAASLGYRLVRRLRPDLPKIIARDYAGTIGVGLVVAVLLTVGLIHHGHIQADRRALQDATARAVAYIGDHAPAAFRANLLASDTYEVQAPRFYRVCVPNRAHTRNYCVIVDRSKPFGFGVRPDGSEPNSLLSQGTF